jgi:SAM-dependent methyltransferase
VAHVYGLEPNTFLADLLAKRLRDEHPELEGKYTVVRAGAEDAAAELVRRGVTQVDCILSMQVMCSIPDPERVVRGLYALLKPGGEFLFWEHCRNPDWTTLCVQSEFYGLHSMNAGVTYQEQRSGLWLLLALGRRRLPPQPRHHCDPKERRRMGDDADDLGHFG